MVHVTVRLEGSRANAAVVPQLRSGFFWSGRCCLFWLSVSLSHARAFRFVRSLSLYLHLRVYTYSIYLCNIRWNFWAIFFFFYLFDFCKNLYYRLYECVNITWRTRVYFKLNDKSFISQLYERGFCIHLSLRNCLCEYK